MRTILAVALAAGFFGLNATASVMKNTAISFQTREKAFSEPLPLRAPALPTERDLLLKSLLTPNSIASQMLSFEAQPAFSRASLVASTPHTGTVKPETSRSVTMRFKPGQTAEIAQFTLPEPASFLLVLTGLIGLTARSQMRKHQAKHT